MPQSSYPEKVFVIERLRHVGDEGTIPPMNSENDSCEYRIAYYIVGKMGSRLGKWTWGQYCPFIPVKDFHRLIRVAEDEGTILKER